MAMQKRRFFLIHVRDATQISSPEDTLFARMGNTRPLAEEYRCNGLTGKMILKQQPVCDPAQEEKVLRTRMKAGREYGLSDEFVGALMALIMGYSKDIQRNITKRRQATR
jgi:chorismate mutase